MTVYYPARPGLPQFRHNATWPDHKPVPPRGIRPEHDVKTMRRITVLFCHLATMAFTVWAEPVTTAPRIDCPPEAIPTYAAARAGVCHNDLGVAAIKENRGEEAAAHFERASEAWKAAGAEYKETWNYTQLILAGLYQQQHHMAKVEAALGRYLAIPLTEQERRPEALSRLAIVYADTGRTARGLELAQEAVAAFEALPVARSVEAAYAHNNLGVISLSLGRQEEAETHLRKALEGAVAALGESHSDTTGYQTNLALALLSRGDASGAEVLLRRARYSLERQPGASENQLAMVCAELSAVAVMHNKLATASAESKKALEILRRQQYADPRAIALAQVNLADVELHANRLREAESLLNTAVESERRVAPDSRLLADGVRRMAQLRAKQQRWHEATELYREAIGIYDRVVGAENPAVVPLLREYADTLKREGGQKAEIRNTEVRTKAILGFTARR